MLISHLHRVKLGRELRYTAPHTAYNVTSLTPRRQPLDRAVPSLSPTPFPKRLVQIAVNNGIFLLYIWYSTDTGRYGFVHAPRYKTPGTHRTNSRNPVKDGKFILCIHSLFVAQCRRRFHSLLRLDVRNCEQTPPLRCLYLLRRFPVIHQITTASQTSSQPEHFYTHILIPQRALDNDQPHQELGSFPLVSQLHINLSLLSISSSLTHHVSLEHPRAN